MTQFGPLAWPLVIIVLALVFRRDVGQAMGRVGQVKYRDLEMTFRDDLHQAEQLARSITPQAAKPSIVLEAATDEVKPLVGRLIVSPSPSDELFERPDRTESSVDLAETRPREAIEAAWNRVARSPATRSEGRPNGPKASLVGLLRSLRDRAAKLDQPPPSPEDARRFIALTERVVSSMKGPG